MPTDLEAAPAPLDEAGTLTARFQALRAEAGTAVPDLQARCQAALAQAEAMTATRTEWEGRQADMEERFQGLLAVVTQEWQAFFEEVAAERETSMADIAAMREAAAANVIRA